MYYMYYIIIHCIVIYDFRLSYDEAYTQLKQWLDAVSKEVEAELLPKGTLLEKQEQLTECQVSHSLVYSRQHQKVSVVCYTLNFPDFISLILFGFHTW